LACDIEKACENDGKCIVESNQFDVVVGGRCECPSDFVGDYCEVSLLSKSDSASSTSDARKKSSNAWLAALLIFLTFIMVTCVFIGLLCRYGKYQQKVHAMRWSPSVIFRKTTLMVGKNRRDCEQRQRIISTAEGDSSKTNLCKVDSFANPVYEEVQVPVHNAYMVFKRENSTTLSHDSDGDSGLEFNTSNGSP